MCDPLPKPTSSPASAAGPSPSNSPDGATDLFGQAVVPASPSVRPAKGKPKMTHGISGPTGFGSSASAALSESLASRLQTALGTAGSTWWRQTWKRKRTPLGRLFWVHTASGPRTSGNGCGSWLTPAVEDQKGNDGPKTGQEYDTAIAERRPVRTSAQRLRNQAQLAAWPTPQNRDDHGAYKNHTRSGRDLNADAQLAAWPSPATRDDHAQGATHNPKAHSSSLATVAEKKAPPLASWPSPNAQDGPKGGPGQGTDRLPAAASLASWATPTQGDAQKLTPFHDAPQPSVAYQVHLATLGPTPSGSPAATGKPGPSQLNPRFSLWLMGYPTAWASCGEAVTRSIRTRRRRS